MLRQFEEFLRQYKLRYMAQFPDPPKVSLEMCLERWKIANTDKKIAWTHMINYEQTSEQKTR